MLGKHHPLLRRIRALRRDSALRRSEQVFLAEGLHLAQEVLETGTAVETFVISPRLETLDEGARLLDEIRRRDLPCVETADDLLAAAQDARTPQPVVCLVRHVPPSAVEVRELLRTGCFALVLESVQDPGNLGSIVRSADAAGCQLCFVTGHSADPYHPRAVRATMGSVFRLPLVGEESDTALRALADHGFERVGADPHEGEPYDACDLAGRVALVLGGEAAGLSSSARSQLARTVRIPMREGVESLSVTAAAAVLLFETARQRRR